MIVATKSVDALLKGVISPDKLMISRIDSISKSIQLDPSISTPKKELFVVSNDDIKNAKVRKEFISCVGSKHPECLIMYISKNGRELPGVDPSIFDSYLSKPKHDDVRNAFISLVEEAESKAQFNPKDEIDDVAYFSIPEPVVENNDDFINEDDSPAVTLEISEEFVDAEQNKDEEKNGDFSLLTRIRQSESWAALTAICGEVNASRIVQEVSEANVTFKQSENFVSALQENITAIMSNPDYDTTEKLTKVRSILCDKAYLKAKTNSIIEQNVESIIYAIIDKAKEEVESKTQDMNDKIIKALDRKAREEAPNVRLETIISNRAKVLLELQTLDLEIKGIASKCTNVVNDTVDSIISESCSSTGSPTLDSQIKVRFGEIVPDNLLVVLDNLFNSGANVSKEFGEMSQAVSSVIKNVYALLSYYKEEVEVLGETIRFLKANNIEDTVIANTIMKKTNRLYIHNNDFDSIAITYMLSKYHSRKQNNVLLLDLSGTEVFSMFGINTTKYSDFMEKDLIEDKLLVVSVFDDPGITVTTEEDCQRLETKLRQYAKHYSRIHIMCTPELQTVIDFFKNDVMSSNFMVDCYPTTISKMAKCIEANRVNNTATRVTLVNYVSDSSKICKDLNIMERYDMQLSTCEPLPEIRYCSLHKQDPYDVNSIIEGIEGVLRAC